MSRKTITIERPFTGGEITDVPTVNLDPSQAAELRDAMVENGAITARPEHLGINITAHLNANEQVTGVWVGTFDFGSLDPYSTTGSSAANPTYIVTTADGRLLNFGTNPAGTPEPLDLSSYGSGGLYPVASYRGELILAWGDAVSPFLRYAGCTDVPDGPGGTATVTDGGWGMTGSGSNFTTQTPVNSYVYLSGLTGETVGVYRVTRVASDLSASFDAPVPGGYSGTFGATRVGVFGIHNLVSDRGVASTSGTALTGAFTAFQGQTTSPYIPPVKVGDMVGKNGEETERFFVDAIGSQAALTLTASPGADWTSDPFSVLRRAYGRTVAFHRGRIWWAAQRQFSRRLFYTPPNESLSNLYNQRDSPDVNLTGASQADYDIIGGDDAATGIVSVVSTGAGPLLVLTGDEVWEVHGDPPNLNIRRIAFDIGCLDARSVVSYRGDVYWAAEQGLMRWRGGAIQPVSEGRAEKRWREAIANIGPTNGVIGWRQDERIQMCANNSARAIVYDADRDIWLGRWNWGSHVSGGGAVRAACVPTTFGYIAAPTILHWTGTDTYMIGAGGTVQGPASFRAILGSNVFRGHEVKRVLGGRIRYRLGWQTGGTNQSIGVYYGLSFDPCATLTGTSLAADDEGYGDVWLDVNSAVEQEAGEGGGESNDNYLGLTEREHRLIFQQINPTHPRDFEIDTIWLEIREHRPRA